MSEFCLGYIDLN